MQAQGRQSKQPTRKCWFRVSLALALPMALWGVWYAVDDPAQEVHASGECTAASPGAGDYCSSSRCGPCGEGEGDCDPGQCAAGLECVEEGTVDHCHAIDDGCDASPGAGDYCSSSQCGPCGEGEGDCDPGQCAPGLECVEEGTVDRCRAVDGGGACDALPDASNYCEDSECGPCGEGEGDCDAGQCAPGLTCAEEGAVDRCRPSRATGSLQVKVGGVWKHVCCNGSTLEVSDRPCLWTEYGRVLTDETSDLQFDCPEGSPTDCDCDGTGERMHGWGGGDLISSIGSSDGGPVYPDYTEETCVVVGSDGELKTAWTSSSCPRFRID